ncbi:response regulator [Roseateles sp. L2-2]|uniref:hybrid sensor histidine kinase/response regulator n=1 Tax=Roseateles sp. L2-2 TaxID=3422597 RepID=UPI003D3625E2
MIRVATLLTRHAATAWIVAGVLSLLVGALVAEESRVLLDQRFRARMATAIDREVLLFHGLTQESKATGALRLAGRLDPDIKSAALQTDLQVALRMRPAADALASMNDQLGADVTFVANRNGVIVGEWNRGLQRSPMGQDVSHREYFREAMAGRTSVTMAVSQSTSRRAIFLSAPVYRDIEARGAVIGLVATQFYGPSLDRFLTARADMTSFILSPEGVVMVSTRPEWSLSLAGPASPERSRRLAQGLRYGHQFDDPGRTPILPFDPDAADATIDGRPHALVSRDLGWRDTVGPWRMIVVADLSNALSRPAEAAIGLAAALLCFAALAVLLRSLALRAARHAQETALLRQGERFMAMIELTPTGIGLISDGVVSIANPALRRLVDVEIGRPWPDVYADEASRARAAALLASNGTGSDVELQVLDPRGAQHACVAAFLPVDFGRSGMLIWLMDQTDRLAAEHEIRVARESAEATTRAKGDFFANMSHELRTPMNAIIGMSELALQTELDARQRNYVDKTCRAAETLLGVIDDILDFSRIEAGRLALEHIPFELDEVLAHLVQVVGLGLEEKGVELLLSVPAGLPRTLVGDPFRLGQVLAHVGKHAARRSEQDEVVVAVSAVTEDLPPSPAPSGSGPGPGPEETILLRFSIRDSGPALSPQELARLGRRSAQADADTPDRGDLALAVCRMLVEMMGGTLRVDSMPGSGLTLHFTARLGVVPDGDDDQDLDGAHGRGRARLRGRVLIVDDNRVAREVLAALCQGLGLQVEQASNGARALRAVQAAAREHRAFDWVLMDWQMPEMDGLTAARRLSEEASPMPRIVMVTAFGNDDGLYEAMAELPGGQPLPVLAKPVTALTLRGALGGSASAHAGADPGARRAATRTAMQALAGARLLVVEDNQVNQELAEELLTKAGIVVTIAGNGAIALELLQQAPDGFDGVLMDCQMPVMDGYDATRSLRQDPRWHDLPVIALTANATGADRARILATGMNDHIAKPLNVDTLFEVLSRWVHPVEGAAVPAGAAPARARPATSPALPVVDGLESRAGLATAANNAGLYLRLLRIFLHSQQDTGARLDQAAASDDAHALEQIAHSLRGSSATIGALPLSQAAAALESACRTGDHGATPAAQRRELAQAVRVALDRLLHALGQTLSDGSAPAMPGPLHDASRPAGIPGLEERLIQLRRQLTEHDGAAVDTAERLKEEIGRGGHGLDERRAAALREVLEAAARFDFDVARRGLDDDAARGGEPPSPGVRSMEEPSP